MSSRTHGSSEPVLSSVRRAFSALELLVEAAPHTVRVADVARHLEVTSATASRVLAALVDEGYASRTVERRFTVGPRSMALAVGWLRRLQASAAGPVSRVREVTGEMIMVSQLLGGHEVPVVRVPARDPEKARKLDTVETLLPWATASGRALLGSLAPAQRVRLLPPEPYPRLTEHTTTNWTDLRHAIRTGAKDRLYVEQGETDPDIWCYSVALEPEESREMLALSVVAVGEPSARDRARVHNALHREAHNLRVSLMAS